jgi:hypothetical protein
LFREGDGPSTAWAKIRKCLSIAKDRVHRGIEVRKEALKIDDRRAAIDPVEGTGDLDLARVAGSAAHADGFAAAPAGDGKADG